MIKTLGLLFLSFLVAQQAFALTCTVFEVAGGNGNYNSTTNWSASSGGSSGASLPTSSSVVCLDSHSGNLTVNATSAADSVLMTGGVGATGSYTGTLTFNSGQKLTITSGTIAWSSGATLAGTGTLAWSGATTYSPDGLTFPGDINILNGTTTLGGDLKITGTLLFNNSGTITITGAHNITTGGLTFNGLPTINDAIVIPAGQTLTVTNNIALLNASNGAFTLTLESDTSSSSFNFDYTGTLANENIDNITFTDADASGSSVQIYDYFGGTLTRTTNITNVDASNLNPPGTINNTFSGVTVASGGSLSVN